MDASDEDQFPDLGTIDFTQHKLPFKAEFLQVRPWVDKQRITSHMDEEWQLGHMPGALIRVCGSVANANQDRLEEVLNGIVHASSDSSAWLFSTGLDFGIAAVVGQALSRNRHKCDSPLIGIASWYSVQGREQLLKDSKGDQAVRGDKRVYLDQEPDSNMSTVQLQPDHSHFVLVGTRDDKDDPMEGKSDEERLLANRKKSFVFAHQLEEAITNHQDEQGVHPSPRVLFVVAGDKTTLEEIITYCRAEAGVVLLAVSTGGLATALAEYMESGIVPDGWASSAAQFDELRSLNGATKTRPGPKQKSASAALLDRTQQKWPLITLTSGSFAADVRKSLLDAVISQASTAEMRVRFAVAWDDEKLLQRELNSLPTWDVTQRSVLLRDALQLALELEAEHSVRVCMDNAAPIKQVDLLALYNKHYDTLHPPKYTLFMGELPTVRRASELGDETSLRPKLGASPSKKVLLSSRSGNNNRKFRRLSVSVPTDGGAPTRPLLNRQSRSSLGPLEFEQQLEKITVPDSSIEDAVRDYYPVEVWRLLQDVVPGLCLYWRAKLIKSFRLAEMDTSGKEPPKLGVRWIDVFVWAVLLGNNKLASLILPACQEPIRAAIIGARLCNYMAGKLPLHQIALREAASEHEGFAINLLNLCDNYEEARRMLVTESRHWNRTVLQLGVQSGLRNFCAHSMCQTLCDDLFRGNLAAEAPQVVLTSANGGGLDTMGNITCLLGALVGPKVAGALTGGAIVRWNVPGGLAAPQEEVPSWNYYKIPAVKQLLRMTMHFSFMALVSFSAMESKMPAGNSALKNIWGIEGHLGGGLEKSSIDVLLFIWNLALALDEYYKYAQDRKSFSLEFWGKYDYVVIAVTFATIAGRVYDLQFAVDILSFNVILVWCRIFKYLSSNMEIGLLVIMIVNMLEDIYLWGLVSMVFLGAFTVSFISITDPAAIDVENGGHPLSTPLWAMLGDFNVEELSDWNPQIGTTMLWLYVIVSNVILVNLLIAMMGHTFGEIKERADEEWKFGRLQSVLAASDRMSPIPPPFNLPLTAFTFVREGVLGYAHESGRQIDREALSLAKKAKQRVARKLLLKYKLQQEREHRAEEDDDMTSKLDFLVKEVADLKAGMAASFGGRGAGGPYTRRDRKSMLHTP